ncbi:hypothetical protein ACQ4PT_067309 [Festuca glaucescens]
MVARKAAMAPAWEEGHELEAEERATLGDGQFEQGKTAAGSRFQQMVLLGNHLIEMREHERRVVSGLVTCISNQIVQWEYESGNSILTPAAGSVDFCRYKNKFDAQHWWDFSEMDFLMIVTGYGKFGDFSKAEKVLKYMSKIGLKVLVDKEDFENPLYMRDIDHYDVIGVMHSPSDQWDKKIKQIVSLLVVLYASRLE